MDKLYKNMPYKKFPNLFNRSKCFKIPSVGTARSENWYQYSYTFLFIFTDFWFYILILENKYD